MSRGTTVVAWLIGLGALAGQAVVVPIATAMLEGHSAPIEVTLPAVEVRTPPALPTEQVETVPTRGGTHAGHPSQVG